MGWKELVLETLDNKAMLAGDIWLTYTVRLAAYDRVCDACQVEKAGQVLELLKEGRVSVDGKP